MCDLPKIFVFINEGKGTDWVVTMALCEDGECIAGHVSSNNAFAKHDIGATSEWHHDDYRKHCPDGFDIVWVDDPKNHEGVTSAYKLNQMQKGETE